MSMFGNVEKHEMSIPLGFDAVFELVSRTAAACGTVNDENRILGIIRYKTKMSMLAMKNPATVEINVSKESESSTLLRISVSSNDGTGFLRTSSRTYDDFMDALSQQSRV